MNVKSSSAPAPLSSASAAEPVGAFFRIGQQFEAQVLPALIQAEINQLALRIANQTLLVRSSSPVNLPAGAVLQLQVERVFPAAEFLPMPHAADAGPCPAFRLTLIGAVPAQAAAPRDLPVNQPVTARVLAVANGAVRLQIVPAGGFLPAQNMADAAAPCTITLDRQDLQRFLPPADAGQTTHTASDSGGKTAPADILKPGQTVRLEIGDQGRLQRLNILAPTSANGIDVPALIRQLLPKHESAPILLNELLDRLPALPQNGARLPMLAADLLDALAGPEQLARAETLKREVAKSGLYLEARLAELIGQPADPAPAQIPDDLKSGLLKLAEELAKAAAGPQVDWSESDKTALTQLQQKTDSVLAKILLDQLNSLPKDDAQKQIWSLDIPYLDRGRARSVSLQIQHNRSAGNSAENRNWTVTVTLSPPGLGLIQCRLCCFDQAVNTFFYSQEAQTAELIDNNLELLKQQMQAAGLKPGIVHNQHGLQTVKPGHGAKASLVDLKA